MKPEAIFNSDLCQKAQGPQCWKTGKPAAAENAHRHHCSVVVQENVRLRGGGSWGSPGQDTHMALSLGQCYAATIPLAPVRMREDLRMNHELRSN